MTVADYGWGSGGRFARAYDRTLAPVWAEGRPLTRTPATGLAKRHESEQGALIGNALGTSVRSEIRRRKKV